jgi:hypothetical protein
MKVLWLQSDDSLFSYSEVADLIKDLEKRSGLSLATLVQDDLFMNMISLRRGPHGGEDERIWGFDGQDEPDEDPLDEETWRVLDHFHRRWEEGCKEADDPVPCLLEGLTPSPKTLEAAVDFTGVKRGTLPEDTPLHLDLERDLIQMDLHKWNRDGPRWRPKRK